MTDLVSADRHPNLHHLVVAVLEAWPKHEKYIRTNMTERDDGLLDHSERLAAMVIKLAPTVPGGLESLAVDYRFIAESIMLPEELHFRRTGEYRLKTFKEALEQVYSNKPYMTRYMNGLLVTDVLWLNHCRCMRHYAETFLPSLPDNADVLEVGPGHGLLLCLASQEKQVGKLTAWDISEASLDLSKHSLDVLSPNVEVDFVQRDLFADLAAEEGRFDAIVFSEVLEHLEDPLRALEGLLKILKPGGRIWVNVPANSPAPDHLYLIRHPDEAANIVRKAGFEVLQAESFAMSGTTLERAITEALTVNCVVVGVRAAS